MRKFFLPSCFLLTATISLAQSAADLYKKADSLYKAKDYIKSAYTIADAIRIEGKSATVGRYWAGASSWALAGYTDSAFHYLNEIAQSDKVNKLHARNIEFDADFISIQNDKRWKLTIDKIVKRAENNGYLQEEFVYGRKDGMGLTLIRITPKIKSNGKAIIYVISGGWNSGYNGIEMPTAVAEQFLKKGYSVFAVMHGSHPRYTIPEQVEDLKRAVRYIRYNSMKFGIDPNHIGITGTSSGGHLSLLIATADEKINLKSNDPVDRVSSRVQAVAVLFPPTDVLNWGGEGNNMVHARELLKRAKVWEAFNFKTLNETYRYYEEITDTSVKNKIGKEISPVYAVSSDDPPVFIIHGDADQTVPLQQSQSIIDRFNKAGVINRFVIKKAGKHNGDDMNPEWQEFVDWFDKYLK